jgi:hypothetical protein
MNPSNEEIARYAYLKFLTRGGYHEQDKKDWYEAEQELKKQTDRIKKRVKPIKKSKKQKA